MKNIVIFIIGFVVGLVGFLVIDNIYIGTEIPVNPDISVSGEQNNEENYEIKIIEGELTGFADSRTIELVTSEGPISCRVYDDNMVIKLEGLIDTNIRIEVKYNKTTQVNTITKIL